MEALLHELFRELAWWQYALLVLAGAAAGFVNTLAGNGSVFTLSTLIFFGLPLDVANGTNRIGSSIQSITAVGVLRTHDRRLFRDSLPYLLPSFIGAQLGSWVVVDLGEEVLRWVFGGIMLVLLAIMLANPKKGLEEGGPASPLWVRSIAMFAIGFYGGFIQAGIGIMLIVSLVALGGHSLVKANAIKLVVVLAYSLPVLGVFIGHNDVHWGMGLWLALGQAVGSFVAARWATKHPAVNQWIRRLLFAMILLAVAKLFGLLG
jgi:hypothetical protein